jgi:hypothetical protein
MGFEKQMCLSNILLCSPVPHQKYTLDETSLISMVPLETNWEMKRMTIKLLSPLCLRIILNSNK